MSKKFVAKTCEFTLHEDDWNEGEGKLISHWDEANIIKNADTVEGVLEQISYLDCNFKPVRVKEAFENDPCHEKEHSRFDADLMVDIDGERIIKPTEEKYKQFERGEVKLYALHVTVYIHKQTDLDESDVKSFK